MEIVGYTQERKKIDAWLQAKIAMPTAGCPVLLVTGPIGCGKTHIIDTVLEKHHFTVTRLYPDDIGAESITTSVVLRMTHNTFNLKRERIAIVLDSPELYPRTFSMKGFIKGVKFDKTRINQTKNGKRVKTIIKSAVYCPIIAMSSNLKHARVKELTKISEEIRLAPLSPHLALKLARMYATNMKLTLPRSLLQQVVQKTKGDNRRMEKLLEYIALNPQDPAKTDISLLTHDMKLDPQVQFKRCLTGQATHQEITNTLYHSPYFMDSLVDAQKNLSLIQTVSCIDPLFAHRYRELDFQSLSIANYTVATVLKQNPVSTKGYSLQTFSARSQSEKARQKYEEVLDSIRIKSPQLFHLDTDDLERHIRLMYRMAWKYNPKFRIWSIPKGQVDKQTKIPHQCFITYGFDNAKEIKAYLQSLQLNPTNTFI